MHDVLKDPVIAREDIVDGSRVGERGGDAVVYLDSGCVCDVAKCRKCADEGRVREVWNGGAAR